MTKYFLTALSVILILVACNKKPTTTTTPDREAMLRTGKWKISGGTFTMKLPNGADTTLNYTDYITDCHKDDYIMFDSLMHAAVYSGTTKCDLSDPDHIPFVWKLSNDGNNIDLYNGFNNLYGAYDSIYGAHFDTLINDGTTLKLDTIHGVLDTVSPYYRSVVVLDSIWNFSIDTLKTPQISIYNASITGFSQSSFVLNFSVIRTYPDTTGLRATHPRFLPDTMRYKVNYTNF